MIVCNIYNLAIGIPRTSPGVNGMNDEQERREMMDAMDGFDENYENRENLRGRGIFGEWRSDEDM